MKERLVYFDQMKGLAMILVVMGHMMLFAFRINPSEPSRFIYFNMPMFFYISGYLAYKKIDGIKELGNKILRRGVVLLVPYLVFCTLYSIFAQLPNTASLLLFGRSGYWFLYDLFVISCFFLIWECLIGHVKNDWISVGLWIIPFLVLCAAKYIIGRSGNEMYYSMISSYVNYYRYYLIGYLCHKYIILNDLLFKNDMVAALGFVLYFLNWYYFEFHNILLIFGGTLGGIIVVQRFFQKCLGADTKVGYCLSKIGKMSLAIYVIHYFFIPDVSEVMHNILRVGNPFIWQLLFAILLALPIVGACMFIGKLIETNKFLNLVFFGKWFK